MNVVFVFQFSLKINLFFYQNIYKRQIELYLLKLYQIYTVIQSVQFSYFLVRLTLCYLEKTINDPRLAEFKDQGGRKITR